MGGDYSGHYGWEDGIEVSLADDGKDHPVLKGVGPWTRRGKLYKNPEPEPDVTLLLTARNRSRTDAGRWLLEASPRAWGRRLKTHCINEDSSPCPKDRS